jgi:dTDP-4-dehydrorhamnose reductase
MLPNYIGRFNNLRYDYCIPLDQHSRSLHIKDWRPVVLVKVFWQMKHRRLLIFGGSGFVGGNLALSALQQGWQVLAADSVFHPGLGSAGWERLDITDPEAVKRILARFRPDAVVNLAALADIDRVERERELAWKINVDGARFVAESCRRQAARLVFLSSDAVFDGLGGPYRERDLPAPLNYYGATKMEAEEAVIRANPEAVVVRISLVLGFPATAGNSFLASLEQKLAAGESIVCPVDEVRTPIDVHTLCACLLELAQGSFSGILHLGGKQCINRCDLSRAAAEKMGYPSARIIQQEAASGQGGRAARHKHGMLDVSLARSLLNTPLLDFEATLEQALVKVNSPAE